VALLREIKDVGFGTGTFVVPRIKKRGGSMHRLDIELPPIAHEIPIQEHNYRINNKTNIHEQISMNKINEKPPPPPDRRSRCGRHRIHPRESSLPPDPPDVTIVAVVERGGGEEGN
jgi:hypothetical protein